MSDHDFSAFAGTLIRYGANTWAWSDHTPAPQVKDLTLSEHYNFRCRTNGRGGALVEVPVKLAASEDDLAWCAKRGYDKALSGDDTGMRRLHPDGRITRQSEREGGAAIREVWLVPAEDWDARPPVGVVWAQDDEPAILAKARELGWSAEVG